MLLIISGDGLAMLVRDVLVSHGPVPNVTGDFVGRQFEHAAWEGLHYYYLIFPLFLFLVGVAIPLSLTRLVERESRRTAHLRVLRRSALLLLLGFLYYGGLRENWPDVRLLGVLQRI